MKDNSYIQIKCCHCKEKAIISKLKLDPEQVYNQIIKRMKWLYGLNLLSVLGSRVGYFLYIFGEVGKIYPSWILIEQLMHIANWLPVLLSAAVPAWIQPSLPGHLVFPLIIRSPNHSEIGNSWSCCSIETTIQFIFTAKSIAKAFGKLIQLDCQESPGVSVLSPLRHQGWRLTCHSYYSSVYCQHWD